MNTTIKAQTPTCPPGYTLVSVVIPNINGCDYNVTVCVYCPAIGMDATSLHIFSFAKVDPNCNPNSDPNFDYLLISNIIYQPNYVYNNLCQKLIPPCDTYPYGIVVDIFYNICWEKLWYESTLTYFSCETQQDCYCWQHYQFCWDHDLGYQRILLWQDESGPCLCRKPASDVPDPPKGQVSDCFFLQSPCNMDW